MILQSVVTTLSTSIIVFVYGIGLLLRKIIVALLNVTISVRLKHTNTEKPLLIPLLPTDLNLQRRNNHVGVCLKTLMFDAECPLAYKIFRLSPYLSVIVQIRKIEDLWIGFSRTSDHRVQVSVGEIAVEYHLVTEENAYKFAFLQSSATSEIENVESIEIFDQELTDDFINKNVTQPNLVSPETQAGFGYRLIQFAQTLSIEVSKIMINQRDSFNQCLNFTTDHLSFQYEPGAYVVRLENFIVDFVENQSRKDLLQARFSERLSLRIGENLQLVKLTFDNEKGCVMTNLCGTALSELIAWSLKYQNNAKNSNDTDDSDVKSNATFRKNIVSKTPFRFEVSFSAQVIVETLQGNTLQVSLSDLRICYDNTIDSGRIVIRVGNLNTHMKESIGVTTSFLVGLIECNLTSKSCNVALCEETTLLLDEIPLATIRENLQLHCDFPSSDGLLIILDDNIETHLIVSGSATAINRLVEHLGSVMRDLLDTLLPNRLFIPGLAEARKEYHQRTDAPLSAEKNSQNDNDLPQQTALLFSLALAPSNVCRLEIKLNSSQTLTSFSVLTADLTMFEGCFYALPSNLKQFCERNLTSSWAIDVESLTLHDSVQGSHWRHAFRAKTPMQIRFIQKSVYLPIVRSEKKLGFYNSGDKLRFDAHLHESFLRFMIDYYKELVPLKDNNTKTAVNEEEERNLFWSLRFAPLQMSISYKPMVSHGSLVNGVFFDTGIPNISLSSATVSFKAYQIESMHNTFGAAMSDYFGNCFPQIESILLSASKALPGIQPLVQTASDLAADLSDKNRTWKQTIARVTSNVVYSGTKLSVAAYKVARSTDRWLAKKQKSHLHSKPSQDDDNNDNEPLFELSNRESITKENVSAVEKVFEKNNFRAKESEENISIYANQPRTVHRGLSDGAIILQENAKIAFNALVTEPKRAYKYGSWQNGAAAALYGLPRAITRSATGLTGATVKFGHGLSNAIDEEKYKQRHNKWKSESYTK